LRLFYYFGFYSENNNYFRCILTFLKANTPMRNLHLLSLSLSLLILTGCGKDDTPIIIPDETSEGVFIDSPVAGLTYSSEDLTGITDAEGKFAYKTGKQVKFTVGDILVGEAMGEAEVTPLDLVSRSDINTPRVRNIAAFLQSLDNDNDAANGILITTETDEALQGKALDFDSPAFVDDLQTLITELNSVNNTNLVAVNSYAAAVHMASSLGISDDVSLSPLVLEGRQWEEGTYYEYNTNDSNGQYVLKIGANLTNVRQNFGNGMGYYMHMKYTKDSLSGYGNFFRDLDSEEPVDSVQGLVYNNRISSPGLVFDYGGETYLSLNGYFKTEGEPGELTGTYKAFLFEKVLYFDGEPEKKWVFNNELEISQPDADGNYSVTLDRLIQLTGPETYTIQKEDIATNNIFLIRFQDTDHIFIKKEAMDRLFDPGEYLIKN
jgi:hypothetical protein